MSDATAPAALSTTRFTALDAFRGIGALAIACFHIHRYGPLPAAADQVLPDVFQGIIDMGWMAVQMFLVLAGFVTAYSLRNVRMSWPALANFSLRRVIRLGGPYWLVVVLVTAMSVPAIYWLRDTSLTETVSLGQFLACLFFLQDILGFGNISAGMWFVCIDLQFGLLMPLMLGAAQWLARGRARGSAADVGALLLLFLPLAIGSLFFFNTTIENDMWVYPFFFMPFLGILGWWTLEGRMPRAVFWSYVALLVLGGGYQVQIASQALASSPPGEVEADWLYSPSAPQVHVIEFSTAILTGVSIYLMGRFGVLTRWFALRPLQYLGAISYSLFLIHYPVSWCVTAIGYRLTGDRPWPALGWLALALTSSIGAAHLLHRYVEAPTLRLASRLKSATAT